MAVVREGKSGNIIYRIHDDYIRTPEEIRKILERCGEIVSLAYMRISAEETEKASEQHCTAERE